MQKQKDESEQQKALADVFCPFIQHPDSDCYCVNMNGLKLNFSMRFCLRDYRSCRIYRRIFLEKSRKHDEKEDELKDNEGIQAE